VSDQGLYDELIEMLKQKLSYNVTLHQTTDIMLAVALSIYEDQPTWIMIGAPPSSGKTELLKILGGLKKFYLISNLTTRYLFSGHPSANGGFMISTVKKSGILAFPDFTTVLSKDSNIRNEIFNQLRIIYDGKAGMGTGLDTGKAKEWQGKVAVICLVTEAIETYKEKTSDLGERFVYYSFPSLNTEIDLSEFSNNIIDFSLTQEKVKELIRLKRNELKNVVISDKTKSFISQTAKLIAWSRATVERNGYSRQIEHVHHPESPYRLMKALLSLYKALVCINGDQIRTIQIIRRIAFSTIPLYRIRIIGNLQKSNSFPRSMKEITSLLDVSPSKVYRIVDDLCSLKILKKQSTKGNKIHHTFSLTEEYSVLLKSVLSFKI
jgi:hypothetical protein